MHNTTEGTIEKRPRAVRIIIFHRQVGEYISSLKPCRLPGTFTRILNELGSS